MHHITIQFATDPSHAPKVTLLRKWAKKTLQSKMHPQELTLRIVGVEEMTALNAAYRHKSGPTNVLSFPFEMPEGISMPTMVLGDIVICADVVNQEAASQQKTVEAHWAHMIVHGIFHLFGYDHETDEDAAAMEALEIDILQQLGFGNPYDVGENVKHYG